jgi:hypothetical protein
MRYALLCATIMASSALALELHPGGALVPEETRAVEEAREWHEAAVEAAREEEEAAREEEEAAERQGVAEGLEPDLQFRRMCFGCRPRRFCCRYRGCRRNPICRGRPCGNFPCPFLTD